MSDHEEKLPKPFYVRSDYESVSTLDVFEIARAFAKLSDVDMANYLYAETNGRDAQGSPVYGQIRKVCQDVLSEGRWHTDVENGVYACHVEATRFDNDIGEWVIGVVEAPPGKPWTHWRHLRPPPSYWGDSK